MYGLPCVLFPSTAEHKPGSEWTTNGSQVVTCWRLGEASLVVAEVWEQRVASCQLWVCLYVGRYTAAHT